MILANQKPPLKWEINVEARLREIGEDGAAIVIDVKPKNVSPSFVTLFELVKVWGYSYSEWTPVLFGMRGLLVDESPLEYSKEQFAIKVSKENQAIFSILYLSGTVCKGKIVGKWLPPGASSTNSALLWPEAFDHFYKCKCELMDQAGLFA